VRLRKITKILRQDIPNAPEYKAEMQPTQLCLFSRRGDVSKCILK
jgi:hypothetical protein